MRKFPLLFTLSLGLMASVAGADELTERMEANVATEDNLKDFSLVPPVLTEKDVEDIKANDELERNEQMQQLMYDQSGDANKQLSRGQQERITIEIFQRSEVIGKQFLLVREDGAIRYAFAVSAAAKGHSTPTGNFGVTKQNWRHMSASYPSRGENNMDHVTYFKPMYGFHSTTFGVYSLLGTRQSHGCVRLGRPQARAVFSLIKANGGDANIKSYSAMEPNEVDVKLIRKLLAQDFNFIQDMIKARNKGDVPFTEEQYYQFLAGEMDSNTAKALMKRKGIGEILEVDNGKGRFPRGLQLR